MPPSPLLFDLDGTLIDSLPDICASANYLRNHYGLPSVPMEVASRWVGDGVFVLMERGLAELDRPFEEIREEAWHTYSEHHYDQCIRLVRPYPGVVEHLTAWHAEGRPMAVVTNKPSRFAARILDHLDLSQYLPVAVCGDTLDVKKPAPDPLHEALHRLGATADGAMMVGDGLQDLRAGKAAGLRTAAVLFGFRDADELRAEGADEYWSSFGVRE